jgi:hypothetical protein
MPRRHCRSPVFLGSLIDFGMVMDINHRNVCLHASHPRCWNTGKSPVRLTSRLKLARKGRAVSLCQDLNPESNWSLLPRETSVLFILVVDRSGFIQFWERPRSFEESVKLCFDDAASKSCIPWERSLSLYSPDPNPIERVWKLTRQLLNNAEAL